MAVWQPKVRIVSDGTGRGTHVYDAEGNEVLKGAVRGIAWELDSSGRVARCRLELTPVRLEAEAALEEVGADVMPPRPVFPEIGRLADRPFDLPGRSA